VLQLVFLLSIGGSYNESFISNKIWIGLLLKPSRIKIKFGVALSNDTVYISWNTTWRSDWEVIIWTPIKRERNQRKQLS